MTASAPATIPRWRSLGPITLFTSGPWEAFLPTLILGALVAAAWLGSPLLRILAVTDWRIAGAIGAALLAMIAVRVFATIWHEPSGAWPFVLATAAIGAVALAAASQTVLAPELVRAGECAPLVAVAESRAAMIVSYALPVMMWIAWLFYLLTRFPRIERVSQLMPGRDSRYRPYARALRVVLPVRLLLSAIVVAAVILGVRALDVPPETDARTFLARLSDPSVALIDQARGGSLSASVRGFHASEQEKALARLAVLDLDGARIPVRRCACDWRLPGSVVDPRIEAAEHAFRTLDREIEEWSFAWKPSVSTSTAVLNLLPLGSAIANDAHAPLYPLLWRASSPPPLRGARVVTGESERVTYRKETVLLVRRSTIATSNGETLAEVAVKLLGRSSGDESLPALLGQRLHSAPDEGPCPIAGGSYCALWSAGRWKLRLAPDPTTPVTPEAPLWLTLYDPAYFPGLRACCG
ncbi:MAG: hypothetical protein ABI779_13845 [Acidobacteriota bacterium]